MPIQDGNFQMQALCSCWFALMVDYCTSAIRVESWHFFTRALQSLAVLRMPSLKLELNFCGGLYCKIYRQFFFFNTTLQERAFLLLFCLKLHVCSHQKLFSLVHNSTNPNRSNEGRAGKFLATGGLFHDSSQNFPLPLQFELKWVLPQI